MNSKVLLLSLVFVSLFYQSYSNKYCVKGTTQMLPHACEEGCTGTPSCGNVDNTCKSDCPSNLFECKTTELPSLQLFLRKLNEV